MLRPCSMGLAAALPRPFKDEFVVTPPCTLTRALQIAGLSSSVLALKRLVESHLREKGQAAELLKGYVTTITREVRAGLQTR